MVYDPMTGVTATCSCSCYQQTILSRQKPDNIHLKAKHIPGTYNRLADLLSRFQIPTFKHEAPASMNSYATGRGVATTLFGAGVGAGYIHIFVF